MSPPRRPASLEPLARGGLSIKPLDGPIGAASALKMSYAAITKGLTAIASASILAAAKYGASDALYAELASSQKGILPAIARSVPDMFPKAYRFVGEMEEIADHFGRASSAEIYRGMAKLYQEIADDMAARRQRRHRGAHSFLRQEGVSPQLARDRELSGAASDLLNAATAQARAVEGPRSPC